jgi:hypothetical protein
MYYGPPNTSSAITGAGAGADIGTITTLLFETVSVIALGAAN